jgi:hypothetical protein
MHTYRMKKGYVFPRVLDTNSIRYKGIHGRSEADGLCHWFNLLDCSGSSTKDSGSERGWGTLTIEPYFVEEINKTKQHQITSTSIHELSMTSDPGILAFGTSVCVNDDLRRGIGAEIHEIDECCSRIKEALRLEKKVQADLVKSRSYAESEVLELRQGANDVVDTLNMNLQILLGLQSTLQNEISSDQVPQDLDGKCGTRNHKMLDDRDSQSSLLSAFEKGQKRRLEIMEETRSAITSKLKQLRGIKAETNEMKRSCASILAKIDEDIEVPLSKLCQSNEKAQQVLAGEISRQEKLKENIQGTNTRVAALKRAIELKVSF